MTKPKKRDYAHGAAGRDFSIPPIREENRVALLKLQARSRAFLARKRMRVRKKKVERARLRIGLQASKQISGLARRGDSRGKWGAASPLRTPGRAGATGSVPGAGESPATAAAMAGVTSPAQASHLHQTPGRPGVSLERPPFFTDMSRPQPSLLVPDSPSTTAGLPGTIDSPSRPPAPLSPLSLPPPQPPQPPQPAPGSPSAMDLPSAAAGQPEAWGRSRRFPTYKPRPAEGLTTSSSNWARDIVDQLRGHAASSTADLVAHWQTKAATQITPVGGDDDGGDAPPPPPGGAPPPPVPLSLGGNGVPLPPPDGVPDGGNEDGTQRRRRAFPSSGPSKIRPAVLPGYSASMLSDLDVLHDDVHAAMVVLQAATRGFLMRQKLRGAWGKVLVSRAMVRARLRSKVRIAALIVLGQTGKKKAVQRGRRKRRLFKKLNKHRIADDDDEDEEGFPDWFLYALALLPPLLVRLVRAFAFVGCPHDRHRASFSPIFSPSSLAHVSAGTLRTPPASCGVSSLACTRWPSRSSSGR